MTAVQGRGQRQVFEEAGRRERRGPDSEHHYVPLKHDLDLSLRMSNPVKGSDEQRHDQMCTREVRL